MTRKSKLKGGTGVDNHMTLERFQILKYNLFPITQAMG